jgi:hypothetical protein
MRRIMAGRLVLATALAVLALAALFAWLRLLQG